MDSPTLFPPLDPALQAELAAAYDRWMALCIRAAEREGVNDAALQADLAWMHWRVRVLSRRGHPARVREIIDNLTKSEAWVLAEFRAHMAHEAAPPKP